MTPDPHAAWWTTSDVATYCGVTVSSPPVGVNRGWRCSPIRQRRGRDAVAMPLIMPPATERRPLLIMIDRADPPA